MRIFRLSFWACSSLAMALLAGCVRNQQPADLLVYNGTIYTANAANDTIAALAIRDGRIIDTGTLASLTDAYQFDDTLNLNGQTVVPGFNDAHCHVVGYAQTLGECNLVGTQSMEEMVQRLQAFAANSNFEVLVGRGWDQNRFSLKEFPTRQLLDEAFPNTPVYLTRIDGHAVLVNGAMLRKMDITAQSKVAGGKVILYQGEASGLLLDRAEELVDLPPMPRSKRIALLQRAEANLLAEGITSLTDAGLSTADILLIDSLQRAGALRIRINAMVSDGNENLRYWLKRGPIQTPLLRVHSFKFYADGALGSRGALLRQPYADDPHNFGIPVTSVARLDSVFPLLAQAGFQACTHAIGDSATHTIAQLYAKHMPAQGRWRIEHAQVMERDDMTLACEAGAVLSVQPTHATSDAPWAESRLGPDRLMQAYAYRDMLDRCGWIPLGTDFPVEGISPIATFVAATLRQNMQGQPEEGFLIEGALSREEALWGMTTWPARAAFEETEKGTLEVNKWADFVILDRNIITAPNPELAGTRVVATYLAGKQVKP
jgi:predicted amidohydrolase YtcJ